VDHSFERNGDAYKIDGKEVSKEQWEALFTEEREKEELREAEEADEIEAEDEERRGDA